MSIPLTNCQTLFKHCSENLLVHHSSGFIHANNDGARGEDVTFLIYTLKNTGESKIFTLFQKQEESGCTPQPIPPISHNNKLIYIFLFSSPVYSAMYLDDVRWNFSLNFLDLTGLYLSYIFHSPGIQKLPTTFRKRRQYSILILCCWTTRHWSLLSWAIATNGKTSLLLSCEKWAARNCWNCTTS